MYSGTPAAAAPGVAVGGMITSVNRARLAYSAGVKNFGAYGSVARRLPERLMHVLSVELVPRERKCAGDADGAKQVQRVSPRLGHSSPLPRRPAIWPAARTASAMIVSVGFFSDADGNTLPSTT